MKKFPGISLVVFLVLISILLLGCGQRKGEGQTAKVTGPVKIIVGATPGGGIDISARGVQPYLQEALGVPVVIENMPGAGTKLAAETFNKNAKPDGNTLLAWAQPVASLIHFLYKPDYDFRTFEPVYQIVGGDWRVITVSASSPYKTFEDLLKASKSKPLVAVGTGAKGSVSQLQSIYLKKLGLNHKYVAYDSGAEGSAAILGGHGDLSVDSTTAAVKYVKEGKLRVVAVHAPQRSELFPDSPTFKELGYEGLELPFHIGIYAPPKTPSGIIKTLEDAFGKATSDPKFVKWAKDSGVLIKPSPASAWKEVTDEWYKRIETALPEIEKGA